VLLLKSIREAQDMLMALSKDRTPETAAPGCFYVCEELSNSMAQPAKYGRRIARKRNRANMAERGLIPLPQSGRCCWMAGRKT